MDRLQELRDYFNEFFDEHTSEQSMWALSRVVPLMMTHLASDVRLKSFRSIESLLKELSELCNEDLYSRFLACFMDEMCGRPSDVAFKCKNDDLYQKYLDLDMFEQIFVMLLVADMARFVVISRAHYLLDGGLDEVIEDEASDIKDIAIKQLNEE